MDNNLKATNQVTECWLSSLYTVGKQLSNPQLIIDSGVARSEWALGQDTSRAPHMDGATDTCSENVLSESTLIP